MKPILLVADVHLASDAVNAEGEGAHAFFTFLQRLDATNTAALYILGDLCDVWVGDDDDSPLALHLQRELKALTQRGVLLFIQHGNRDFMMGMRLMRACGGTLLPDAHCLPSGGNNYLLMHGDSLVADEKYLAYRRRIRHPLVRGAAAQLPLKWRRHLAAKMRRASRGGVEDAVIDEAAATTALRTHTCSHLIHGHLHHPGQTHWQEGEQKYTRTCLPAWTTQNGGWAELADGELQLRYME